MGHPSFFITPQIKMSPTVTFEEDSYIFTLVREDKEVVYKINASHAFTCARNEKDMNPSERAKIDGPAFNGILYYVHAWYDENKESFTWLSKEEYDIIDPVLTDINDDLYYNSEDGHEECDNCHGSVGRCGGRCTDRDLYY